MTKQVYRFFSYNDETGFELHVTEEEAKAAAAEELKACADEAVGEDGWPEWTESICWGEVKQSAKETNRRPSEPEDGVGFWDYICDYEILDLGEVK